MLQTLKTGSRSIRRNPWPQLTSLFWRSSLSTNLVGRVSSRALISSLPAVAPDRLDPGSTESRPTIEGSRPLFASKVWKFFRSMNLVGRVSSRALISSLPAVAPDRLDPGSTESRPTIEGSRFRFISAFLSFAVLVYCCLVSLEAAAVDRQTVFDEANRAYEQGKFPQAVSGYEQLLKDGARSSAIYFNLGNAWFRSGHPGKAIARYRMAERLSPRDTDIRANLDFARRASQEGDALHPKQWGTWSQRLTTDEWTLAASFCLWLLLLTLAAIRLRPSLKPTLKNWNVTAAVMLLLTSAGLAASHRTTRPGTAAVIAAATAAVRYGPFDESQSHFTLRDGAEVAVVDRKGDWAQIRDASQRTGWLKTEHLAFVDLPDSNLLPR